MEPWSRKDVDLDNQSTYFTLCRESALAGLVGGYEALRKLVEARDAMGLGIYQDDPISLRLVIGDALEQGEDTPIARYTRRLHLPEGRLIIMAAFDPENRATKQGWAGMRAEIELPPGDYRVDILTMLSGINGTYCYRKVAADRPMAQYFRDTRPGEALPAWLAENCYEDADTYDPQNEALWENPQPAYESGALKIDLKQTRDPDFVIQLRPWTEGLDESAYGERGYGDIDSGATLPERFPLTPLGLDRFLDEDLVEWPRFRGQLMALQLRQRASPVRSDLGICSRELSVGASGCTSPR